MKSIFLCALMMAILSPTLSAADNEKIYELRIYHANPGKLDALHERFRNHTVNLFAKHGMENIGYWVPVDNAENKLIYLLAFPSRDARDKAFQDFGRDPEWRVAYAKSTEDGRLVDRIESHFLNPVDYSPKIAPDKKPGERLFELRTYTATSNNLNNLHSRFRDHTVGLFSRHGMTHFGYWTLSEGQEGANDKLIYILAHKDQAARDASFDAFRKDRDWVKAKGDSEKDGSLTAPGGVESVLMKPTDYSPTR